MPKKIIKRTQGAETLYFGTHTDAVQAEYNNNVVPLTSLITTILTQIANRYTKSEVDALVANIHQFSIEIVSSLPTASADTMWKIYLIPSTNPETQNVKDEFVTVQDGNTYRWEQIGSTAIDLSDYSTTAQMNAAIASALSTALASYSTTTQMNNTISTALQAYYTKTQVDSALGGKQDVINDLSDIRSGAAAGATAVQPGDLETDVDSDDNDVDLSISDENGNSIVSFRGGDVATKNFDSRLTTETRQSTYTKDFVISDENGNALLVVGDGHVATKNFDSRNMPDIGGIAINQWYGKSICFIGDSFIEQGYVINAVSKYLGCTVFNRGWGGAMITPTEHFDNDISPDPERYPEIAHWVTNKAYAFTGRFDEEANNNPTSYVHYGMPDASLIDLLVIHGGTNDYGDGAGSGSSRDQISLGDANVAMSDTLVDNKPSGSMVSMNSFAAALKYTCYKARTKYPHIPIAICTLFSSYTWKTTDHTQGIIDTGTMAVTPVSKEFYDDSAVTREKMNDIIWKVAKMFGFYVIEMDKYSACGINDDFGNLNFRDGDCVHPSEPYGAWNYGVYMANQILDIPYYDKNLLNV